jgi:cell shape-determining protein MreC
VKTLTREQLEKRKEQAVRFVRDIKGDPDRADEMKNESLEDYAERRRIKIENPRRRCSMASKRQLEDRIKELEEENEDLNDRLDQITDLAAPEEDEDEQGEE